MPNDEGIACRDNPTLQRARNCRGEHRPVRLSFGKEVFERCPAGEIRSAAVNWWNEFSLCRNFGVLPCAGGLDDQPARTVQAFTVIMRELARIEDS